MNRQEFEKRVSEVLVNSEDQTFRVFVKGAEIIAETYEIDTGSDNIVYLRSCEWIIATVNISDITDVR
jgi:hypothetical protein